jgi:hypothetical protein
MLRAVDVHSSTVASSGIFGVRVRVRVKVRVGGTLVLWPAKERCSFELRLRTQ